MTLTVTLTVCLLLRLLLRLSCQRARSQLRRDSALRIPAQRLSFGGAAIEALRCSAQKCTTFQHVETIRNTS